MSDFLDLADEFLIFSLETFSEATAESSLEKLRGEAREVEIELEAQNTSKARLADEYADCLMCLLDSAQRAGVGPRRLLSAFQEKVAINKARTWTRNPDNTYSHVKS